MVAPRRRFPGGSVGQYFICRPTGKNYDPPDCDCFLTEDEALEKAQEWANSRGETIYITKYLDHCIPEEPDA